MIDSVAFEAPYGVLGRVAERTAVRIRLSNVFTERAAAIRAEAEVQASRPQTR